MLKKLLCAALVTVSALSLGASTREWRSRYNGIMQMLERRDVTGFEATFDPSFVSIGPKGEKMTREEFFKMIDGMFKDANKVEASIQLTKVSEMKGRVDVGFDFHLSIRKKGGAMTHVHEIGTDSWKQFNHKWYVVKTVDKSLDMGSGMPRKKSKKHKG